MLLPANPRDEISEIPDLVHCGNALVEFAESFLESPQWVMSSGRWILNHNVLTLRIASSRAKSIRMTLTGYLGRYQEVESPVLPLKKGFLHHPECVITSPCQLAAAASYIACAFSLHRHKRAA